MWRGFMKEGVFFLSNPAAMIMPDYKLKIESEKSLLSFSFFWDCPCVIIPTHLLWIVYCAGGRNATKIKVERPFWLYWSGSKNKMVGDKSSTIQEFFLSSFKGRMGRSARFTFMTRPPFAQCGVFMILVWFENDDIFIIE